MRNWALLLGPIMRLRMLGAFQVEGEPAGKAGELFSQPKVVGLLSYLLLARPRGVHSRNRLIGLFWPEADEEHARGALRNLLSRLKQTLGEDTIETRGSEFIGIVPGSIWCDALAFDEALAEDRLREALDLYQGDLLLGTKVDQAEEFERWLESERAYYESRAVNAAWTLVQRYVADSELTNAGQLARVVARMSPTNERMLRRVMSTLVRLGDRAGAIDVFTKSTDRMWRELEIGPSRETMQLVDAIRSGAPLPG